MEGERWRGREGGMGGMGTGGERDYPSKVAACTRLSVQVDPPTPFAVMAIFNQIAMWHVPACWDHALLACESKTFESCAPCHGWHAARKISR